MTVAHAHMEHFVWPAAVGVAPGKAQTLVQSLKPNEGEESINVDFSEVSKSCFDDAAIKGTLNPSQLDSC